MFSFLRNRILLMIPTLLGVSIVVFLMLKFVPGDPVDSIASIDASEAEKDVVRQQLGLDKPLYIQYFYWLAHIVRGDLGHSLIKRLPVSDMIFSALGHTMILVITAAAISLCLGILIGVYSAYYPKSWLASLFNIIGLAGIGIPNFWAGLILIGVFSVILRWLPSSGMYSAGGEGLSDLIRHLILPTIAASLAVLGVMTRMVRSTVVNLLQQDFVFALQAKGCKPFTILRHIMKNGTPTILTVAGLQFGLLMGSSVLVEIVFSWPGAGQMIYQAIGQRDYPVVQAGVLVIAVLFVLLNLAVDAIHATMDPRIRHS